MDLHQAGYTESPEFNPPFSETELRKYFNRSTIKVLYSCKTNIKAVLSRHNKKLLSKTFKTKIVIVVV